MLLVILPRADVLGTIGVSVRSVAVSLVIDPVSFVDIAVCVVQLSATIGLSVPPFTFIAATIKPFLLALAITYTIQPFAFVDSSAVELHGRPLLPHILSILTGFHLRCRAVLAEDILIVVVAVNSVLHLIVADAHDCLTNITVGLVRPQSCFHLIGIDAPDGVLSIRGVVLASAICEESRTVSHFLI